jgi:pimeloyl-ACP methyl ester carboxylesterase
VKAGVTPTTRVLIGHSLGSVVAYEALCANPDWRVHTLLTLGSPLGVPELVFDRLTPRPQNGCGAWPNVQCWVNIADNGDIVALVKALAPFFPAPANQSFSDRLIYNGWASHSAERYLSAREAGEAVATALA